MLSLRAAAAHYGGLNLATSLLRPCSGTPPGCLPNGLLLRCWIGLRRCWGD